MICELLVSVIVSMVFPVHSTYNFWLLIVISKFLEIRSFSSFLNKQLVNNRSYTIDFYRSTHVLDQNTSVYKYAIFCVFLIIIYVTDQHMVLGKGQVSIHYVKFCDFWNIISAIAFLLYTISIMRSLFFVSMFQ